MTLTAIKKGALLVAVSTTLIGCDALEITGGPLDLGAAQANNLLDRGGFEDGFGAWRACGDPTLVSLQSNNTNTVTSAKIDPGGCLYQSVPAQANDYMIASCSARKSTTNWASMTFAYLDADYQPLKMVETALPDTNFTVVSAQLRAPTDTAFAEVLVYAEDGAVIDDCELVNTQAGMPTEYLLNSWFEDSLNGWQTCATGSVTVSDDVATIDDSCISQKFTSPEDIEFAFSCDGATADNQHAGIVIGYLDGSNQPIGTVEAALPDAQGVQPRLTLAAPSSTAYVQVMVYAEGQANVNNCSLTTVENTSEM